MIKKVIRYILAISLSIMIVGCSANKSNEHEQDLLQVKSINSEHKKKVIYLLVDSLMAQSIDNGIQQNLLPNLKYLIEHGQYYNNLVSSFPTMSITIDSSLFTGAYANHHRVPGLVWYSTEEKQLINYGTGPLEIMKVGVASVLENVLIKLNRDYLNPELATIHEELNEKGLTSSSINGIIYRGNTEHTLTMPEIVKISTGLQDRITVKGPDYLAFGALANPLINKEVMPDGITDRLGFNNEFAIQQLNYL